MAIPDYESLMQPLLKLAADRQELKLSDLIAQLGVLLSLTEEEMQSMLPSGVSTTFGSRVGWAKTYLKQAGLLEQPRRGVVRITKRGMQVLAAYPQGLDNKVLSQFPEFQEFRKRSRAEKPESGNGVQQEEQVNAAVESPLERLDSAAKEIAATLVDELLAAVRVCSPSFFEELVVQLLLKMGYGGSRQEAGRAVGRSGDGGIDGVISEDRLGLDSIYVQAKRWQGTVGEPEVRNFLGALVGRGASKGVLITTGAFSEQARQFAARSIQQRIVLIDGDRLASLMIEHDLGVATIASYQVKRMDSDFFADG